jgi:serine/threonine protein kinase
MRHEDKPANGQAHLEEGIFMAALEVSDPAQRVAFLERASAGDERLRIAVENMLSAQTNAEKFFALGREAVDASARSMAGATTQSDAQMAPKTEIEDEHIGQRVGRYKLLQRLGEGGCGVVYMAEQEEPVRRRVALKIIKLGMDTKSVIARFEAERQALAMMDHPNIARALDAGATETGRPYFVMELVRGYKLTEYCDQSKLDTRQRLDLFVQVCNAIQHAHQKGIIHRDIKPSNILVTLHDGKPVPKVIDFGIAKAIEGKLTEKTLFTAYEQFIGTPAYMSPEQAEMSGLDVDTRSDIYSLGVLLYELLTGKTPFDQKELLQSGLIEMRRKLKEDEPKRPSSILTTLHGTELRATMERRQIELPRLVSLLKGDLDWIVMKALEKDRTRRYETVNGLALDVSRYLNNELVAARPPSRTYRFQKLVRRNRALVLSSVAVALALIIGLGAATWMYFKQVSLRKQAEAKEEINQAAIYVSEKNFEAANEILDHVKILPTRPSYDGVMAYRRVGDWLAMQKRWAEAADRYSALMEIDKLEAWQVVTLDYQACGALLAESGNRDRYNDFCKAAIGRFRSSTNGDEAGRILKTCLLFPSELPVLVELEPMAKLANEQYRPVPMNWPVVYLALWDYRRGDFAAVDRWCRPIIGRPGEPEGVTSTLGIIQAMADQKRGRSAEAARELVDARHPIENYFNTPELPTSKWQQGSWYDWLFARILLREATGMVEIKTSINPGSATQ